MNPRFVAASLAVLGLGACAQQTAQDTYDQQYPDHVLARKYGVENVVVGHEANAECGTYTGGGYRVSFTLRNGKVYAGTACHEVSTPQWVLVFDAGTVILNDNAPVTPNTNPPATRTEP